jgi:methionine-S-sulfoxide reductase
MWKLAVALVLGLTGAAAAEVQKAVVAGGCFWCVESDFEDVPGVLDAVSGYTGGASKNPTYKDHDGHYEAVEITFDSAIITYDDLIGKFLRSVDVLDDGGQFCDRGSAYRTAIFALDSAQRQLAEAQVAKAEAALGNWCPEEDSNLHALRRWYLKPVRLPIPPSGREARCKEAAGQCQRPFAAPCRIFRQQNSSVLLPLVPARPES